MKKLLILFSAIIICIGCNTEKKPKYVFLFIGDGMGLAQAHLANEFLKKTTDDSLNFMYFPQRGSQLNYSLSSDITCSAASGTAFACGKKTFAEHIGVDKDNKPLKSIAYIAKDLGMKVGILTTVPINHATPAVFYAHNESRHNMHQIAMELPKSNFDYFAGGSFYNPVEGDESVFNTLKDSNYTVITSTDSLQYATQTNGKLCILNPQFHIDLKIDNPQNSFSLERLTEIGIEKLYNDKGFFMMIEGGQIDWACHSNDATTAAYEVIGMAEAISQALKFYKEHPDETLIIVTGDHETGGLSLGSNLCPYYSNIALLQNQTISFVGFENILHKDIEKGDFSFEQCMNRINEFYRTRSKDLQFNNYDSLRIKNAYDFVMNPDNTIIDSDIKRMYNSSIEAATYAPQNRCMAIVITINAILNEKAGIGWATFAHTGIQIPVYAIGAGSEKFMGIYDNTDIPHKIQNLIQ